MNRATNGVNFQWNLVSRAQKVPVVALPVEDHEGLVVTNEFLDQHGYGVRLAGAGTAEDGHVLDELVLAKSERMKNTVANND